MKKLIVFIAMSITCYLSANAQAPIQNFTNHPRAYTSRYSAWEETNFNGSLDSTQRWQYQVDFQYRRMADASWTESVKGSNTSNIFKSPYQYVVRPWIHYWIVPKVVRLSLSPLGYWMTYSSNVEGSANSTQQNGASNTSGQTFQPEFRICPQITINNQIGRLQLSNRYRYEFQFKGNRVPSTQSWGEDIGEGFSFYPNSIGQGYGSTHAGRLRWQFRAMYLFNSAKMEKGTIYANVWNELFLSMGRHTDLTKTLNQNRVCLFVGYKLPTGYPIRIEAGITFQTAYVYQDKNIGGGYTYNQSGYTGSRQVENNLAYTVYVIFDEFHTMFKKNRPQDEPRFPHIQKQ